MRVGASRLRRRAGPRAGQVPRAAGPRRALDAHPVALLDRPRPLRPVPAFRGDHRGGDRLVLQSHLQWGASGLVVAAAGTGLMASSPARPGENLVGGGCGVPDEAGQAAADLGDCEGNQLVGWAEPPLFARVAARVTVRKAWASMARVMWRYQPSQRRTWYWSRPTSPLAVWKDSSIAHRAPATRTSSRSGVSAGPWHR